MTANLNVVTFTSLSKSCPGLETRMRCLYCCMLALSNQSVQKLHSTQPGESQIEKMKKKLRIRYLIICHRKFRVC